MKTTIGLTAVLVLLVTGCSTTQRVAVRDEPGICAFLGEVCHALQPGAPGEAGLRWVNPQSDPTRYTKVIVEVVGFFGTDVSKVPPADQERLTALFQQSLTEALATKYQVVDQPAPGTVQLQVVILDAEAATPGLRSVSMVIPQVRLLGTGYYAVSGTYPFVGGGQAAFKTTDAVTGQVLAAGVDRRVGGGAIQTAAQWQWGDAENAIKAWSQQLADGMYAYTSGARKP
jgi:Protein of unknown function (DUF3313)